MKILWRGNSIAALFAMRWFVNMSGTSTVSTHLNQADVDLIQSLAELEGCDRATLIKTLLRNGLEHLRRDRAVEAYRREKVTLSRVAELAGLNPWEFLALMEPRAAAMGRMWALRSRLRLVPHTG